MADGIYIGMTGAVARAAQLDSIADNLANAQTPGFKSARPAFETFLPPSDAPDKAYTAAVGTGFDLSKGPITRTGEPLDVVPEGDTFLAVQVGGGAAYTRAGHLTVDAQGQLLAAGHPLLDTSGEPISVPPEAKVRLDSQGWVLADEQRVGQLGLFRLEGALDRVAPALLAPGSTGQAVPVEGALRLGELEGANGNPLEATVALVSAQRHYETAMQALQTYRRLDERANEVGRVR